MADLATVAEVGHLRRELRVDDDRLDFLEQYPVDDVRRLRRAVNESLASRHRSTFAGMARAAALLPKRMLPPIAERAIGPLISSKIAAELDPGHARRIVGSFSVPFLADLCHTIDTLSAEPVLRAIPASKAVPVGAELYRRGDIDTLARFIDAVDESVLRQMLEIVDDEALLHIGIVAESRDRVSVVFSELDDARVLGIVEAAVRRDLLHDALVMVAELDAAQLARAIDVVVAAGDRLVPDLVSAIESLGEGPQRDLATSVAAASPEVARRLVALADEHGVGELPALTVLRRATAS